MIGQNIVGNKLLICMMDMHTIRLFTSPPSHSQIIAYDKSPHKFKIVTVCLHISMGLDLNVLTFTHHNMLI